MIASDVLCGRCGLLVEAGARFCPGCGSSLAEPRGRLGRGSVISVQDFGTLTLQEPLGEGGMGVVHRGWIEYLPTGPRAGTPGHPVAVKVLRHELSTRQRSRAMFLREAAALERLGHPNVVRFVALTESAGRLAIVMELVQGEPLSSRIRTAFKKRAQARTPCLSVEQAWHYFAQLLGALAAVHTLGILHRDVKAASIMVRSDDVVKLSDFGIARLPESDPQGTGGMIVGTGAYMSPEQVRGQDLDARSDLYAAAIVFYEMLAGFTPFDAPDRDEVQIRNAQLDDAPRPLGELVESLPDELSVVLARGLAKDRRHRYGSALELGEACRLALGVPPGRVWPAQKEFAALARTLSEPVPQGNADLIAEADRLRTAMMTPFDA
jgi:eukaryotic-like serine/threonine-protein kinase